jgi:hypothetical protein
MSKATARYDLAAALQKHLADLKLRIEYLKTQRDEAKHKTADQRPIFVGRIIEVEKEIEHLEQVLLEG